MTTFLKNGEIFSKEDARQKKHVRSILSLRHTVKEYIAHYNSERNRQGMENNLFFPYERAQDKTGKIVRDERMGGLLNYYYRETG